MKSSSLSIKVLTALAALALCVFNVSAQKEPANTRTADEAAIRDNVKQMETGWNNKRGAEFAKPFAEDADYVIVNGTHIQGRAAIEKGHQQIFDTIYKNSSVRLSITQLRFLRPDVALVHVSAHLEFTQDGKPSISDAAITLVMARGKLGWEIAAFQNTRIQR